MLTPDNEVGKDSKEQKGTDDDRSDDLVCGIAE